MSRIKIAKTAGMKIADLVKKLKKRKYAKTSKKNIERARGVRTYKSVKAYNIRARDADTKVVPVKSQSQKGSTFQTHRIRTRRGRAAARTEERGKLPSPMPTLERLFKKDVRRGKLDDYRLTRMYLRNKLSDIAKKKKIGGIMPRRIMKKPEQLKQEAKETAMAKEKAKANMYLTGGQAKLDKNKNNKIDAEDFKILRSEKAKGRGMGLQDEKMKPGKVKPVKAVLGLAAMGLLGAKMLKGRKKKAMKMAGKGSAGMGAVGSGVLSGKGIGDVIQRALRKQSKGGVMKARMGKATDYQKYLKGLKKIRKETYMDKAVKKQKEISSEFLKRRKQLAGGALKAAKATRIGKIAAGVAGAALLGKAALEKAYEKRTGKKPFTKRPDKKMGGGMMKKPMMAKKGKAVMIVIGMKPKKKMGGGLMSATQKLKAQGKMGGGMMQRPMMAMGGSMMPGYKKGKSVMAKGCKLGRKKTTKMYT